MTSLCQPYSTGPRRSKTKTSFDDLAISGSPPAFSDVLHVGRPNMGDRGRLFERIGDILDRAWLTNHGPCVEELEERIAERCGVKHCIAVCNATVGLEIAVRAAGLHGEVIVPSFTFVATAHALRWLGITPVFCDVDPKTHTLDPERVEELLTSRTTGILGVHLWGSPCSIESLEDIARRHELALLFDAAHAFACSHRGVPIGGFGDCEVFSFHATKFFNTFEGGAITTNDDSLANNARLMSNFGFAGYDTVVSQGTNGKMNEISAAMGLTGLESIGDFIACNRRNYEAYKSSLRGIPGVSLLPAAQGGESNFQYVVLEIDQQAAGVSRDALVEVLRAENILARRYFYPGCHNMEPYRTELPHSRRNLPVTEQLVRRVLVLPTGDPVGVAEISTICETLRIAIQNAPHVNRALAGSSVSEDRPKLDKSASAQNVRMTEGSRPGLPSPISWPRSTHHEALQDVTHL